MRTLPVATPQILLKEDTARWPDWWNRPGKDALEHISWKNIIFDIAQSLYQVNHVRFDDTIQVNDFWKDTYNWDGRRSLDTNFLLVVRQVGVDGFAFSRTQIGLSDGLNWFPPSRKGKRKFMWHKRPQKKLYTRMKLPFPPLGMITHERLGQVTPAALMKGGHCWCVWGDMSSPSVFAQGGASQQL